MIPTTHCLPARTALAAAALVMIIAGLFAACDQNGKDTRTLSMSVTVPEEALGWRLQDSVRTYNRQTIFDYINGAGEVYLAYDFRNVAVYTYAGPQGSNIIVELFDMGTDQDAYGIFSHSREDEQTGIGQGWEYQGGLLSYWQNRFFVCIQTEQNLPAAEAAVFELARQISRDLPAGGVRSDLVDLLPTEGIVPFSVRFFHLHSSLNYHYYLTIENILHLDRETQAVLAAYDDGQVWLLCVRYPSPERALEGHIGLIAGYVPEAGDSGAAETEPGLWVVGEHYREYLIAVFDAPSIEEGRRIVRSVTERIKP